MDLGSRVELARVYLARRRKPTRQPSRRVSRGLDRRVEITQYLLQALIFVYWNSATSFFDPIGLASNSLADPFNRS